MSSDGCMGAAVAACGAWMVLAAAAKLAARVWREDPELRDPARLFTPDELWAIGHLAYAGMALVGGGAALAAAGP